MKLFLTREDYEKLRKKIAEKEAKLSRLGLGLGDAMSRSGSFPTANPEYAAVHLEMQNLQQSIDYLKNILDKYEIADENKIDANTINIYSAVTTRDAEGNEGRYYLSINELEKPLPEGYSLVTPESPLGQALLGRKVGEEIMAKLPRGEIRLQIITHEKKI
jgi:transcription elongation factor GreA